MDKLFFFIANLIFDYVRLDTEEKSCFSSSERDVTTVR